MVTCPTISQTQDRESSQVKDQRFTTVLRRQCQPYWSVGIIVTWWIVYLIGHWTSYHEVMGSTSGHSTGRHVICTYRYIKINTSEINVTVKSLSVQVSLKMTPECRMWLNGPDVDRQWVPGGGTCDSEWTVGKLCPCQSHNKIAACWFNHFIILLHLIFIEQSFTWLFAWLFAVVVSLVSGCDIVQDYWDPGVRNWATER